MLKASLTRLWRGRTRIFHTLLIVFAVGALLAPRAKASFWDVVVERFLEKTAVDDMEDHANQVSVCIEEGSANTGCTVTNNNTSFFADLTMRIVGVPEEATTAMSEDSKIALYRTYGKGAVGDVQTGLVAMYAHPAASTPVFLADILNSAHIVPTAQAQGLGFASLDPILEAWKVFRNVAYLFFVAIFLIIGFMIMFRSKISGQTVVTAQQAIPQVIVALITVTFSYAIAGVMIDVMYLVMYMIIGLFGGNKDLIDMNIFQFGKTMLTGDGAAGTAVYSAVTDFASQLNLGSAGDVLGFVSGITLGFIVSIAILIGILRLFFDLLKTYVTIVLLVAFAPVFLMLGAIPGKNPFKDWISQLIGNLSAFPAVLLLLVVYNLIMDFDITTGGFMPPYLIGQGAGSALVTLVGVGILLAMPETIQEIKKALGAKEGIFSKLAQDAWKRAKDAPSTAKNVAWEGKGVPFGLGAKKIIGGGIKGTMGLTGAALGYAGGDAYATEHGLTGRKANIARLAGATAGFGLGANAISMGSSAIKDTFTQARQAVVASQIKRFQHEYKETGGDIQASITRSLGLRGKKEGEVRNNGEYVPPEQVSQPTNDNDLRPL
ncbi:MAG: hypothetical protein ACOZAN_01725 [Patescibacteria group bacterium]